MTACFKIALFVCLMALLALCFKLSTIFAAGNLGRRAYGFEIKKEFVEAANEKILPLIQRKLFV